MQLKKRIFFIITFIVAQAVSGQSKDLYLGTALSFHCENRGYDFYDSKIFPQDYSGKYGDYKSVSGSTIIIGTGIRMQKQVAKTWGINFGFNYMRREIRLESSIPYSHVEPNFDGPWWWYIQDTKHFGYKTIEGQIGVIKYFHENEKWQLYGGLNLVLSKAFQSYYIPEPSQELNEKLKYFENYMFGKSITAVFGASYNMTDRFRITAEPVVRIVNSVQDDYKLQTMPTPKFTYFDNFGLNVLLMYRIN